MILMMKLNKRQKYIKDKFFELVDHDPLQYSAKDDELLKLAPHNLMRIINLIIKILEEENDGEINWAKIT